MWICERCGEPHQDNFKVCWKCAGDEMTEPMTAEAIPAPRTLAKRAPQERTLRSLGSILARAGIAGVVGMVGGMALFHRNGATLEEAVVSGSLVGVGLGAFVGIFVWVVFPYEPIRGPSQTAAADMKNLNHRDTEAQRREE